MGYEQLHFAFGASIPFLVSLFFYKKRFIFIAPMVMTLTGTLAFLPYFFNWHGTWTNIFFLYNIIQNTFSRGQFTGYALIIVMFTVIVSLQAFYIWRIKNA